MHDQQLGFVLVEPMCREKIVHNRMMSKWATKKGKKVRTQHRGPVLWGKAIPQRKMGQKCGRRGMGGYSTPNYQ
jgi:hypothetical protein